MIPIHCTADSNSGRFLITAGMILVLAALGLVIHNFLADSRAGAAAEDTLRILEKEINEIQARERAVPSPADTGKDTTGAMSAGTNPAEPEPAATLRVNGYDCIGILEIPRLSIRLPVLAEWDKARLETAPCLYSGSLQQDNIVICGHNYRRHFSPIKTIPAGTEVTFTTVDGQVFRYLVRRRETVQPEQISDMTGDSSETGSADITKDWDLTLFTCNTGGRTRCAVRCVRKNA